MRQPPHNPIDSDGLGPSRSPRPAGGQRRHVVGFGQHRRRRLVLRSPRPATVWPCFGQERQDGTQLLAAWLQTAIVKIVTTYTQPGDRVLLLTARMRVGASPSLATDQRTSLPEFAGLSEAAWTVARLGRRIRTWTGGPSPADDSVGPINPRQSESGLRPDLISPGRDRASTVASDSDPNVDRFNLIITTVVPHATDWVATVAWPDVLEPGGTLAVITHSDIHDGRLLDPTGALVTTIRHHGLTWLDHVILLKAPIAGSAPDTRKGPWVPLRHTRVHDDLLLFNAVQTGAAQEDSSDE